MRKIKTSNVTGAKESFKFFFKLSFLCATLVCTMKLKSAAEVVLDLKVVCHSDGKGH